MSKIENGEKISFIKGQLNIPNNPIIPFIEGDGIGADIWYASQKVFNKAVAKAYDGEKIIVWKEVLAGRKANKKIGFWLPDETLDSIREYLIAIKGPLTTPVGGGMRSLNVSLRQILDLYACVRPVKWFEGVPSPVKNPDLVNMIIFRENTEDIYAGIEWMQGTKEVEKVLTFLKEEMLVKGIRFPGSSSIGIKPVSIEGTERIIRASMDYAIANERKSLTIVHKGNIMKFTEGKFKDWGYELVKREYGSQDYDGGPWQVVDNNGMQIIIKDVIADAFLQQILLRPAEYDVIVTLNLNGDYISDALAAIVGGIGIAPGANINYKTGHALFEATHGTAPKYAGKDMVNPSSLILSGVMMLEYMGWQSAADLINKGIQGAIKSKTVTYDFHRLMNDATKVSCSGFSEEIIKHM